MELSLFMWGATFCPLPVISSVNRYILLFVQPISCLPFDTLWSANETEINSSSELSFVLSWAPLSDWPNGQLCSYTLWHGGIGACSVTSSSSTSVSSKSFSVAPNVQSHLCASAVFWNSWFHVLTVWQETWKVIRETEAERADPVCFLSPQTLRTESHDWSLSITWYAYPVCSLNSKTIVQNGPSYILFGDLWWANNNSPRRGEGKK
jgi:hypothetical protein